MPSTPFNSIGGRPGTYFVNRTRVVLYQLRVAGFHTCSYCYSLDGCIAEYWPIPLHKSCRCTQYPVYPGQPAPLPFVNRKKKIRDLPAAEQRRILGDAVYRLFRAGVITLDDIIDDADHGTRSLADIIRAKHLTNGQLAKAGIPAWIILLARKRKKPRPEPESEPAPDAATADLTRRLEAAHAAPQPAPPTPAEVIAGATASAGASLLADDGRTQAEQLLAALAPAPRRPRGIAVRGGVTQGDD